MKLTFTRHALIVILVIQIVMFDAAAGLFSGLLIFEKTSRWPILLVVVPLVLFFNLKQLGHMEDIRRRARTFLVVVYAAGFVYGVVWTISSFEWWKLLIIPVPLLLLLYFLQRVRNNPQQ